MGRNGSNLAARSPRHNSPVMATARTCIGCRHLETRDNLLRLVATPDGKSPLIWRAGPLGAVPGCTLELSASRKSVRGLSRALRVPIAVSLGEIYQCLFAAAWRRAESLGRAARRAGHLIIGAEAGALVWRSGKVAVAIVAQDARAAAVVPWVGDAQQAGRSVIGPPKSILWKMVWT